MTRRSVILGLAGAVVVCAFCFLNDRVLRQTYLVGNNMPASIYGALILFVLLLNPLLRGRALKGRELAVILALTLAACCVPGGGFMRQFIPTLVMPHRLNRLEPGWRSEKILDAVPARMLVDVGGDEDRVVNGFVQGLGHGAKRIGLADVPWRAWVRPTVFWLPMVLTAWVALIGLSLVLHPQWSRHEHLPYPIARFTEALFPDRDGVLCRLFRQRLFWIGTAAVLGVHLNNLAYTWFPSVFIRIPTSLDMTPLGKLCPLLLRGNGGSMLRPHVFMIIIGLAYFIPADVSFSFGLGPLIWFLLVGFLAGYGINLMAPVEGTSYFALNPQSFALFGANVGVMIAVFYTGRRHYWSALRGALGGRVESGLDSGSLWGCRAFLLGFVLFVVQLCLAGIEPIFAIAYATFMIIGFVVLSRVIAETGQIYLKCYFWPCATLWGLLGARAVGPEQLLLMMMVSTILFIDPREALMPFMTNSLRVLELRRQKLLAPSALCVVAIIVGLAVALPLTLYLKYDMGNATGDSWATNYVPKNPFDNAVMIRQKLQAQGLEAGAVSGTVWSRLGDISPTPVCLFTVVAGLLLVLLFTAARLRFAWWPFHPLMFVTWASTPLRWMGPSYLMGWAIKSLITKYGGSQVHNRLKPLFMGFIAGEVLGALIPSLIGTVYYFFTEQPPRMFNVLPG